MAKGKKEILRGLANSSFEVIIVAKDCDAYFLNELIVAAKKAGIDYKICLTRREIASLTGLKVPCGAVGVFKKDA